jgi:hypothetical protein
VKKSRYGIRVSDEVSLRSFDWACLYLGFKRSYWLSIVATSALKKHRGPSFLRLKFF